MTPRTVPGDPSASAFFVVAGCVVPGSGVEVEGIYQGPARLGYVSRPPADGGAGDASRTAPDGTATITATNSGRRSTLRATTVAAAEIPSLDEIPALAVAAAVAEGTTVFSDVGELRVKEVDRLRAVIEMVTAFGATAEVAGGHAVDHRRRAAARPLHGARFDSQGDHRMAMAAAVAALAAGPGERSLITGFGAVETSYPGFADDLRRLTGTGPAAPRALVIAIDGPAGAGKSTVSRAVAATPGPRPARYGSDVPRRRRPRPGPAASRPTITTPWPRWPPDAEIEVGPAGRHRRPSM